MSNLNTSARGNRFANVPKTLSYEGNIQFVKTAESQLYELAVMSLYGKDAFYESTSDKLQRLQELVNEIVDNGNLDFIANTIVHARTIMNVRTMPIVLTVEFAAALQRAGKLYPYLRTVVRDVIQRADQLADMYAYALATFGSKRVVPMAIKRGVADAFNKFGEYHFAKYARDSVVKLRDVLRIVHPKAKTEDQGKVFERLVKDELKIPYTWETELSINGQLPEAERKSKAQLWSELVTSGKMGYMGLLRNLRNILEAQVDDAVLKIACDILSNEEQVAKSKQFPYRFLSAMDATKKFNNMTVNRALIQATDHSLGSVPEIGKKVWLILDCSLSMKETWQTDSRGNPLMAPMRIAAMFGAAIAKSANFGSHLAVTMFSDSAKDVEVDPSASIMTITKTLLNACFGGGTNLQSALDRKSSLNFEPDTVVVISDMQVSSLRTPDPSDLFAKDTIKIALDVAPYESTPIGPMNGWLQLAGWSDKIFDFIPAMRNKQTIVSLLSRPYVGLEGIRNITSV